MKQYTPSGAESLSYAVWNLYEKFRVKFGDEKAWQFVLTFYHGAGSE